MNTSDASLPAKDFLSLLDSEQKALDQIARGVPLPQVLEAIILAMERQSIVRMHASILFLDRSGRHLVHGVAPSLPPAFNAGMDGLEIGPAQASGGTAAFRGEPVCVPDVATDPLWEKYRGLALAHGLHACWSAPIRSIDGELLGVFSEYYPEPRSPSAQDIDAIGIIAKVIALLIERHSSAEKLRGAESRYRQIFNSATDFGIISADLHGLLTSWNEGARRIFGWCEEEMLGQPMHRLFTPEDIAAGRPETEMACTLRDGYATDERWHVRKSGQRFWASGALTPLRNDAGEAIGFVKILRDRTEQKRTEQDLQFLAQASAELGSLIDPQSTLDRLASLAVQSFADWCVVDLLQDDGTLKRVAAAHKDPQKRQLAQNLVRRFPLDPNAPHGPWKVLRTGQAELIDTISDGTLRASVSNPEYLAAIRDLGLKSYIGAPLSAHGKTLGVVGFASAESARVYGPSDLALAEDLARRAAVAVENANLYRVLQQSDYGKDIFLATLAHELRNPLAAITNGLSIMKLTAGDRGHADQSVRIIERQVGQLTRLVDDLMDVSRIATGKIELRKERTSLASILNIAVETSRPHIELGKHKLSMSLPGGAATLYADPVRLAQVFSNLLNNAAKYTNPGGQIDVRLECTSAEYIVRIRDNGIGISAEMLTKIFSIFAQVAHPLERSQGGLGIGLFLVEGLVRMHGGRVEAFSAGPNLGSEFVVHLPRQAEPSLPAPAAGTDIIGESNENPKSRRVLVVDDNIDAALTVAEILGILGNEVTVAHDGLAAVTLAVDMKPDVVLLDIGLPGIDGYEAARRIRAHEDSTRIRLIAITGWGQEKDRQRASEAGFDDHWVKPVSLDQLRKISA